MLSLVNRSDYRSKQEMYQFLAINTFILESAENYIEIENVEEKELTLKKARKDKLIRELSIEKL